MMRDLYLIRHARSVANETPKIIGGRSNHSPLADIGVLQSHSLKERLDREEIKFDAVYVSPAVRTIHTALIAQGRNYQVVDALQELDRGDWTGKLRSSVITPQVEAAMKEDPYHFKAPGGESPFEVGRRMMSAVKTHFLDTNDKQVGFDTHGIAIRCLLVELLEMRKDFIWNMEIANASITQLGYDGVSWRIKRINDHAHTLNL